MSEQERIDSYLDDLARALKIDRARARRVLAETEDHLREATHDIRETGVDEDEAARLAIERFGTATAVANRFSTELRPPFQAILMEMAIALAGIAAVGLIAIGISGGLAGVFGKTFGWSFVAGDQPGVTYTAERCAEYLRYSPSATTCAQAALDDHSFEVVGYRIAAGSSGWWCSAPIWSRAASEDRTGHACPVDSAPSSARRSSDWRQWDSSASAR
jgi:hypothetical protein